MEMRMAKTEILIAGAGQKLDHLGLFGTVQIDLSRLPTRFRRRWAATSGCMMATSPGRPTRPTRPAGTPSWARR